MKKTNTILIILAIVIWGLFFSNRLWAQVNINMGITDLKSQREGEHLVWGVGYAQYLGSRYAIGVNYRWTHADVSVSDVVETDAFGAWELVARHRVQTNWHRLEPLLGINYNTDDNNIRPMIGLRNAFRLDDIAWISLDIDYVFDKATYLMFGLNIDVDILTELFIPLNKPPRFY